MKEPLLFLVSPPQLTYILFFHFEIIKAFYLLLISNYRLYPQMLLVRPYAKISTTKMTQILLIQVQMIFSSKCGICYM